LLGGVITPSRPQSRSLLIAKESKSGLTDRLVKTSWIDCSNYYRSLWESGDPSKLLAMRSNVIMSSKLNYCAFLFMKFTLSK